MTMHKYARGPLWATLLAVSAAMLVSLFVFAQQGAADTRVEDQHHQSKIIGGSAVPDGKYAFVAALLDTNRGSTAFQQQFCGGTLIDSDSVLTAAHCMPGFAPGITRQAMRVTVGRTVLDSNQGQKRRVSQIFIHPRYNPVLSDAYDSAVLELNNPVPGIAPIRLATASQDFLETPGRSATVAGWGNTIAQPVGGGGGSSFPNRMREAQVPIVSDENAKSAYGSSYVKGLMVAAGRQGKDTCQGDSGGPLFARPNGRYTQIGITSFGNGCGAKGFPGVYSEVNAASIRNFITNAAIQ